MNSQLIPALTSDSRIFIAPRRASCGQSYIYHSCMRMEGVSKSFGDITPVYCPDPNHLGKFIEIAQIEGGDSRWTSSLVGRLPLNYESILSALAKARCAFDIQVHWGKCIDPTNFNTFSMGMVFENVSISSYDLGTLGALSPDERATIDETVAFSAESAYQLFQVYPYEYGRNLTALGPTYTVTYGNTVPCDNCLDSCARFYGLRLPSTPLGSLDIYIIWTDDGGITWSETLLPCSAAYLTAPINTYNIQSDGIYLYITMNETGGVGHLYVVPIEQVEAGLITSTSFSVLDNVNQIYSSYISSTDFWTGHVNGILYRVDKTTLLAEEVLDGTLYTNTWFAMDGLDSDNILLGGNSGRLVLRKNGSAFQTVNFSYNGTPVTNAIQSVKMKTDSEWLVGTAAGQLFCTTNGGKSWALVHTFPGCVQAMKFSTNSVGYITVLSPPQVWRTIDGGATWVKLEDKFSQIDTDALLVDIATCPQNPNTFIATGYIPAVSVVNPCSLINTFVTGQIGIILVGRQ